MPPASPQVTTFTLFKVKPTSKFWAFTRMGISRSPLKNVEGLQFFKLMGTGSGMGFSLKPDFSRYSFLGVWESEADADAFFQQHSFFLNYKSHCLEDWTVWLHTLQSHGRWDNRNPFDESNAVDGGVIAAITRATIHVRRLRSFWKHVPLASKNIEEANGVIRSVGVGEIPWIQQATFSLWKDGLSMKNFAYGGTDHMEIVKKTKEQDWYKEDLFARFKPFKSQGVWNGTDPLEESSFQMT